MYCKNCGRQLKEGMRFCDRCGQSVRKTGSDTKRREIEQLQKERKNRKQRLAEKEEKQARKRRKKKKRGGVLVFMLVIVLIAAVSVIIGYNIFPSETKRGNADEAGVSGTSAPAVVTAAPAQEKYSDIKVSGVTCPYPTAFYSNPVTGNEKLNLTDSLGGAVMIIAQEAKSGDTKELIKDYISEIGANDDPEMRAGQDWYAVTAAVDGKIYHRKCVVRNGLCVYYDFTYDEASTSSKKYEEYISYIDSKFE